MKYLIFSLLFVLFSCADKKDPLLTELEKRFNVSITKDIKRIYFIDENNIECLPCTKEFNTYINSKENSSTDFILINNVSNITRFKESLVINKIYEKNRIVYDDLKMGIVYLSQSKIDSLVNVDLRNIDSVLKRDLLLHCIKKRIY